MSYCPGLNFWPSPKQRAWRLEYDRLIKRGILPKAAAIIASRKVK